MQLTGVPEINQNDLMNVFRYAIDSGSNALIFGPSGGGKTEMGFQIIKEKKCFGIYINMAVLERTDFQGMPVISDDKTCVTYATPTFLPFADNAVKNKKFALDKLISWVKKQNNNNDIGFKKEEALDLLYKEMSVIEDFEEINLLKKSVNYLSLDEFDPLKKKISSFKEEEEKDTVPIVIMFDEVDKATSEVLQTLLEFLQFKSINGRSLDIKACILTANLPDEHAHTNQISHAITKRCLSFKLHLDFDLWKAWAIKNEISPLIIGFLTQNTKYLYQKAPDNDVTAYALASPRTWTAADKVIKHFSAEVFKNQPSMLDDLKMKLVAGAIGEDTTAHFNNWVKHYHELDPYINDLMENGTFPTVSKPDMNTADIFICALSACSKLESSLKPDNKEIIEKYVKNAFNWFDTLQSDVQIGSIRMVFGGNFDSSMGHEGLISKHRLQDIPEFAKVFISINNKKLEWEKLNAARSEKLSAEAAE